MKNRIKTFKSTASLPKHGLVLIFDLEGFSKFFSQPDVQEYVPKYLNHVLDAVKICIEGGEIYWWNGKKTYEPLPEPIHWKFLGDGLLIIWDYNMFDKHNLVRLFNRLWTLKRNYSRINSKAIEDVPVIDIPQRIRFGLASGTIYKLNYKDSGTDEFIGYSINLASRLQAYCPELGFIASARISPSMKDLEKHSYMKIIATKLRGFPREIVIIDKYEYSNLSEELRTSLFEEIE
jgi:class 3 adenylate cyclase